jgi:hypothetical protein
MESKRAIISNAMDQPGAAVRMMQLHVSGMNTWLRITSLTEGTAMNVCR